MRHERAARILPAGSYRDEPLRRSIPLPSDPRADRAIRIARMIDRALPWAFRASIVLALAAAVWGALGGPVP